MIKEKMLEYLMLYRIIMINEAILDDIILDNMTDRISQLEDEFINEYKLPLNINKNPIKDSTPMEK